MRVAMAPVVILAAVLMTAAPDVANAQPPLQKDTWLLSGALGLALDADQWALLRDPDVIGSVRSVRMTDLPIVPSLDGALVYSGGGPEGRNSSWADPPAAAPQTTKQNASARIPRVMPASLCRVDGLPAWMVGPPAASLGASCRQPAPRRCFSGLRASA